MPEIPQTVQLSEIRKLGDEAVFGIGTIITLSSASEIDDFANLITAGLQEEIKQGAYPQYKGDIFKTHGQLSELLIGSKKAKKFAKYPFRGHFDNFRIMLLPPNLSFITKLEGIIPETATTFSAYADALNRHSEIIGEISRTYTLYIRNRVNGPQKETMPYLMVSSSDVRTGSLERFMDNQQQEWFGRWRRVISQGLQHPVSGGLMSLGKGS